MSAYSEFLLGTAPRVVQYDMQEISHPSFSQTYRIVRNNSAGLTVTHEGPDGPYDYEYYPLEVKPLGASSDLEQILEITVGDLGEVLPTELQNISDANDFQTKPICVYRTYSSDDLTAPIYGPVTLAVNGITFDKKGAALRAQAASFNVARTGVPYREQQFPMLQGLL